MNNGESISILRDAWLGGDGSGKIITPIRVLSSETTVDVLLDNNTHSWRKDLISEVFLPIDVDRIFKIPISTLECPDERVWGASKDRLFKFFP